MNKKTTKKSTSEDISWTFKEPKRKFSIQWYILITLFFSLLIVVSFYFLKSWTSITLFIVTYLSLIIYTKIPREKISFMVNEEVIIVNKKKYKLEDYKSFYIKENQKFFSIYLIPKKKMKTELVLQFKEKTGEALVDLLNNHLLMEFYTETFVDKIIKFFGL